MTKDLPVTGCRDATLEMFYSLAVALYLEA